MKIFRIPNNSSNLMKRRGTGLVAHAYDHSMQDWRKEDYKFEVNLCYSKTWFKKINKR